MTEEEKIKFLYDKYNESRNQEMDKFWKNSMYVWTFLGLCFTGYGVLIIKFIDTPSNSVFKLQIAISTICAFGLTLSFVWTWMAQGLKSWYEVHESAIWDMESLHNVFDLPQRFTVSNYWSVNEKKVSKPYSPSALVVAVGWCLSSFWIITFVINILLPFVNDNFSSKESLYFIIICATLFLFDYFLLRKIKNNIISTTLRTKKREEVYKYLRDNLLKDTGYQYFDVTEESNKMNTWIVFNENTNIDIDVLKRKIQTVYQNLEINIEKINLTSI